MSGNVASGNEANEAKNDYDTAVNNTKTLKNEMDAAEADVNPTTASIIVSI